MAPPAPPADLLPSLPRTAAIRLLDGSRPGGGRWPPGEGGGNNDIEDQRRMVPSRPPPKAVNEKGWRRKHTITQVPIIRRQESDPHPPRRRDRWVRACRGAWAPPSDTFHPPPWQGEGSTRAPRRPPVAGSVRPGQRPVRVGARTQGLGEGGLGGGVCVCAGGRAGRWVGCCGCVRLCWIWWEWWVFGCVCMCVDMDMLSGGGGFPKIHAAGSIRLRPVILQTILPHPLAIPPPGDRPPPRGPCARRGS